MIRRADCHFLRTSRNYLNLTSTTLLGLAEATPDASNHLQKMESEHREACYTQTHLSERS